MTKDSKYFEAVGRRKTAVARVRLTEASKTSFIINEKDLATYFPTEELQGIVEAAFKVSKVPGKYKVSAKISGSGVHSQAEALRLGISRALLIVDPEVRKLLKGEGYLERDSRSKERRKFGLKKARKRKQWSKR